MMQNKKPPEAHRPQVSSDRRWFVDPAAIMQIRNLAMRAKSVVEGFMTGLHRSTMLGFSVEFSQYRPYVEGDDPRTLDWKLLARTDRYYVKQFEDETNRRCYLAVDQSRSMAYGSLAYNKAEYARTLAATLAYYLHLQRDAVGLMTCGVQHAQYMPPRHRHGHLSQLMHVLALDSEGTESDFSGALTRLAGFSHRRGLVVLLSDLLVDPDTLFQPLGYLRGRGHEVLVIRILDPTEVDFRLPQSAMVRDMETGRQIYVDPRTVATQYRQRFAAHEKQLVELCHRRGARLVRVTTDEPLELALLELIANTGMLAGHVPGATKRLGNQRAVKEVG
ncbi:MAG: hypothetical protein KatS3mg111_3022 [Pirellulaceae bacterium]|nr:MAG: hypothetical protein KatS3mg111_3022 [Pirellulaceae bacterium]